MITVYGDTPSSNVKVMMWGSGEVGLPARFVPCGHCVGGLGTAEIHQLYGYDTIDIPRAHRPGIAVDYERLCHRTVFGRHVMVPDDTLRVAGA